jgi:mRNA interferase HigB
MRLSGRELLAEFLDKHADARGWIAAWKSEVEGTEWRTPQDIKAKYSSASFLSGNRVIFNVKGGRYRLEVVIAYKTSLVHVLWIGTHSEYSKR